MDKLAEDSRGSFLWTLLQGPALEVVEHLKEEEYHKAGGEKVIFDLLDRRWPEKDREDQIGENVAEVFALKAREGEQLRQWCARAQEVFNRCSRKSGVTFPDEAKGWIMLNCSGMSDSERAVVLARCQGSLKVAEVSQAMRSCFPDYTVPKKRSYGAHMVDSHAPLDEGPPGEVEPDEFDVLLSELGLEAQEDLTDSAELDEEEAKEVLSATWKEKRAEISRLQKNRRFSAAQDVRKSFRVDIEEIKKRSKCWRCNQLGHFAKDCKNARAAGSGKSGGKGAGSKSGHSHKESAAGSVELLGQDEHFVCTAGISSTEVLLVSSPGYAVLDSGCGRTLIGENTLASFQETWNRKQIQQAAEHSETNVFRYGNGEREVSKRVVEMPVCIASRRGIVRAAIVKGDAPLLLSRPALKKLDAKVDFGRDSLQLFESSRQGPVEVPLSCNEAGQHVISVTEFPSEVIESPSVSSNAETPALPCSSVQISRSRRKKVDFWEVRKSEKIVIRHHVKSRSAAFRPDHSQCPVPLSSLSTNRCTHKVWDNGDLVTQECDKWDDNRIRGKSNASTWTGRTVFQFRPDVDVESLNESLHENEALLMQWTPKQSRQLAAQIQGIPLQAKSRPYDIIEVFSPPRFGLEAAKHGLTCLSADLSTGWDFRKQEDRNAMRKIVRETPPELLVCCPPCTWAGGWFHLNKDKMSSSDRQACELMTRVFIMFCGQLMDEQLKHGGRILFEHPKDSVAWNMLSRFDNKLFTVDLHMCRYGMRIPGDELIRKPTRLKASHADMKCLAKTCPGSQHPDHVNHCVIAGNHPAVGSVSKFASRYPVAFVKAVLRVSFSGYGKPVHVVEHDDSAECLAASRVAELSGDDAEKLQTSLRKLHTNLGHPPNNQMVRILKHGGASDQAIQLARSFDCEHCRSQAAPKPALPTQTQRVTEFNAKVGLDVKYLTGWKTNQKIPALNIVDYGSSLQLMVPLYQRETSELIGKTFMERWVSWAGMPKEIIVDPARPNIVDGLTVPLELQGAAVQVTAADAHWQLGKVEVHGGWFNRILDKILNDRNPENQKEWTDCVNAAHCKNQLIQVYGMTPAQHVFGKNPAIPENLLDEPLELIPATASLYEEQVAKQVAVRQSARKAIIELQDDRSLRLALASRNRPAMHYSPGMYVAYWRSQKWQKGVLDNQGRWHGPAIVLGSVGRNLVILHKRSIFRCAPEQVRPSTESEKQLVEMPNQELLGIKAMIDQGNMSSKQYVDLVPESYPGGSDTPSEPPAQQLPPPLPIGPRSAMELGQEGEVAPMISDEPYSPGTPLPEEMNPNAVHSGSAADTTGEPSNASPSTEEESSYGPVRRRVHGKSVAASFYRPGRMVQEDFAEMMQEIVPQLVGDALHGVSSPVLDVPSSPDDTVMSEPAERGVKRDVETSRFPEETPAKSARTQEQLYAACETCLTDEVEVLAVTNQCQQFAASHQSTLTSQERQLLWKQWQEKVPVEALLSQYMAKKAAKEIPVTKNPPEVQAKVDEAKTLEWNTILSKHAARVVQGPEADQVRRRFSHRIMGSRFVMTIKQEDDTAPRVKARWCLQGHLDPDLTKKIAAGDLQSPTLSQVGRNLVFQLIASHRWKMLLGDVKGAFLSAGELPKQYKPLYARLPAGGIPGIPDDALIEVLGHVYGLNDSPCAWFERLKQVLLESGFEQSRFDCCLFYMRDKNQQLSGVYGIHVDDCATGGQGPEYEAALAHLRKSFEFRKWREGNGDFCGSSYIQDPVNFTIQMSQEKFIQKIRPMHLSKQRQCEKESLLTDKEVSCLRAINGSLNWLGTQSRPDLATQVSFSQQSFPAPTVSDAIAVNQAIRRAKQHADQTVTFCPIRPDRLAIMCHSDAAFGNAKAGATQAGFIISFTDQAINEGKMCQWSPAFWRSHRLPRVVNSTLSAEAQSMSSAMSMCEWVSLILAEALEGKRYPHSYWNQISSRKVLIVTDCKSLFDHLISKSSPTLEDRRTAIDIIILRDSVNRLQAVVRWIPTDRMLADALTKENPDAFDLLRGCIRTHQYQISPEASVLELRAKERDRRRKFMQKQPKPAKSCPEEVMSSNSFNQPK